MNRIIYILVGVLFLFATDAMAQVDKRDVRRGNRDYKKENYKEAEIEYRKAIIKDSLSVAGNYNLAADLYRQNNSQEAQKVLDKIKEAAQASDNAADYFYNLGDVAIANQDWQTAVTAFEESLLRNPGDLDAKENYIYAKKKLEEQKKAEELERKIRQATFTLDDYLEQFGQIRNMGSMDQILGMMPGVKPGALKDAQLDEKAIDHQEAIIRSMTRAERENPDIITASRKKRIAAGSGTSVEDVNKLLRSFDQIKKLMKQFSDPKKMRGFGKGKMKIPF